MADADSRSLETKKAFEAFRLVQLTAASLRERVKS